MYKKLTIAIPAYNISQFIDKIIQSIVNTKHIEEIEVLIVNDGSKDRTLELAKEYEIKYSGIIKVIDKKNGGHGSTLNAAIKVASGKYFKIIDGDDWVDSKQLDLLIEKLDDIEDDMLVCSYTQVTLDECVIKKINNIPEDLKFNTTYNIEEFCEKSEEAYEFHRVYYKTDVYKKSKLIDENCFYVDLEYILYPLKHVKSARFLDYNIYMYRLGIDGQSVSVESCIRNKDNFRTVLNSLCKYVSEESIQDEVKNYILRRINAFSATIAAVYFLMDNKKDANAFYRSLIEEIKKNYPDVYKHFNSKKFKLSKLMGYKGYGIKRMILKLSGNLKL